MIIAAENNAQVVKTEKPAKAEAPKKAAAKKAPAKDAK